MNDTRSDCVCRSEFIQKSLFKVVTTVFTVEKISSDLTTPAFKMEIGLIASPLESRGYFMIVVYIN